MKRILTAVLTLLPLLLEAQGISTIYAIRTYHSPQTDYAEINTSLNTDGLTVKKNENSKYVKQAELTTIICLIDNPDSAVYVDKRIIKTPESADSSALNGVSLLDMQRVPLQKGNYVVYFELSDKNSAAQPLYYRDAIQMNYEDTVVNMSDILLIDKYTKTQSPNIYTKNGYDLYPYMFDIIDKQKNVIQYYVEIYNADKTFGTSSPYAVVTTVEDMSTGKKSETIQRVKTFKSEAISSFIGSLDISSLSEGAYYLTVEVRNENNMLYAYKRYPFVKKSDLKIETENTEIPPDAFVNAMSEDEIKEYIRSLRPIASDEQTMYILKKLPNTTLSQDRYFLYHFFEQNNPLNPEKDWLEYKRKLDFVNEHYSTAIKKGYQTDMGRVYLVYGVPNNIIDEKFGASSGFDNRTLIDQRTYTDAPHMDPKGVHYYPYQIWVYDNTPTGESNRKFVFYARQDNRSEYFMLHSNAKGELNDPYWEHTLSHGSLESGVV
ncbi:MAG: GWxTD domain-containing protein, partial [Bacteroidales bacterium]|nr:GWxTD domain-containing protein [Bacteroidales bacterium]